VTYRESMLAFEVTYQWDKEHDPKHPGEDVTVIYQAKIGNWYQLHSEKSSLSVWKFACFSADFQTGLLSFSNGIVQKKLPIERLTKIKDELLTNWDNSHLWTMADTVSQVMVDINLASYRGCGNKGNLIAWSSPYWNFDDRFPDLVKRKPIDLDQVCANGSTAFIVTIPVKPTFFDAVKMCDQLGNGNVTTYFSFTEWSTAFKKVNQDIGSVANMWFALQRINDSFVSFYNKKPVSNIIWSPGKPGANYDCVYCHVGGCSDKDCQSKQRANFQCSFHKRPILFLRGLCEDTNLDRSYYPDNRMGRFLWVGIKGTFIEYNHANNSWIAKIKDVKTWASISTSLDSLLLGTNEWTIYNDVNCFPELARKVRVNLSFCSTNRFSCDDGTCIDLDAKCDEKDDCPDGSDEVGCKFLSLPKNYNKLITSSSDKLNLLTSLEILNIVSINENEGKIRLNMRLHMEWNDPRITFLNLKEKPELNMLVEEESALMWKPEVVYVNMEQKDFEYSVSAQVTIYTDPSNNYTLADYSELISSKMYNGSRSRIHWNSEWRYSKVQPYPELTFSLLTFRSTS
jgi:Neurotransmitter-gated ion-channel ligand binding domain/Low-density lipoprotein receptor domain class A